MQLVAYIEHRGNPEKIARLYMQESDSLGMSQDFFESDKYDGPSCNLDSRVLKFDSIKQVRDFLGSFIGSAHDTGTVTYGYHGITEAGNATLPFVVMHEGKSLSEVRDLGRKEYTRNAKLSLEYREYGLPPAWSFAGTAVARDGELETDEVFEKLQRYIVNQLPEDSDAIIRGIENLERTGWTFTDVDFDGCLAIVHVRRQRKDKENKDYTESASAVVFSLNLMTPGEILEARASASN